MDQHVVFFPIIRKMEYFIQIPYEEIDFVNDMLLRIASCQNWLCNPITWSMLRLASNNILFFRSITTLCWGCMKSYIMHYAMYLAKCYPFVWTILFPIICSNGFDFALTLIIDKCFIDWESMERTNFTIDEAKDNEPYDLIDNYNEVSITSYQWKVKWPAYFKMYDLKWPLSLMNIMRKLLSTLFLVDAPSHIDKYQNGLFDDLVYDVIWTFDLLIDGL